MHVYTPHSVSLPDSCSIRRVIPYEDCTEDKSKEDTRTIFYDVFIHPLSRKLVCLGPTLFNLKKHLFPLVVTLNGHRVELAYYEIERLFFLESAQLELKFQEELTVVVEFSHFAKQLVINQSEQCNLLRHHENALLTISTLQKDNCAEWICDWVVWHKRLCDIGRVILYDNGSSNLNEIMQYLSDYADDMRIIIVDWDFPHGIRPFKSAQHGSLNHCRLRFPIPDGYCINLDIDEYLAPPSSQESLLNYLNRKVSGSFAGAINIKSRIVPVTVDVSRKPVPRCYDFHYVYRKSSELYKKVERNRYFKYIYRFEHVGYNSPHKTRSHKNRIFCKQYNVRQKLSFHAAKLMWRVKKLVGNFAIERPQIDSTSVPDTELYYYHFLGLTTGWQGNVTHKTFSQVDRRIHVPDPDIHKFAAKAKMIPSCWDQ